MKDMNGNFLDGTQTTVKTKNDLNSLLTNFGRRWGGKAIKIRYKDNYYTVEQGENEKGKLTEWYLDRFTVDGKFQSTSWFKTKKKLIDNIIN